MAKSKSDSSPTTAGARARTKWTVMVFMGVAHVEGVAAPLDQHADADVQEMRDIFKDGPSEFLNIFVQRHGVGIPTREKIGKDSRPTEVPQGERNAADGKALKRFMISSLREVNHQPSDVSVLILWGHAYHFALGHTKTRAGIEALDFGELRTVLTEFQKEIVKELQQQWSRPEPTPSVENYGPPRLDILAFDACDLATIEVSQLLQPFVKYMIASQIGIPLPGWPYKTILGRLKEPALKAPMSSPEFGTFAVRKFCEEYQRKDDRHKSVPVSLTLLDLSKAPAVFQAAERLAEQLATAGGSDAGELLRIRELFSRSQTIPGKPFIDVADFCVNLGRYSTSSGVRGAAADLGNILIDPTTNENGYRSRGSFIVDHSRNLHSTARLHGASLYAPHIIADDWRGPRFFYTKFATQGESSWSRLVHVLAEGG